MQTRNTRGQRLLVLLILSFLLAGCGRNSARHYTDLNIDLLAPLFSPAMGSSPVVVGITDPAGEPVVGALVEIRGDMAHAGMVPVVTTASGETDQAGTYQGMMDWNMSGDWIVTVRVKLADGRQASRYFNMLVTGEDPLCTEPEPEGTNQ